MFIDKVKFFDNNAYIYFSLLIISFFNRIFFYKHSYICNDEITMMIIGSEVLNGNLPYIKYFDLKGPLLYILFAITDILGDQIINARIIANIFVFISSILLFKTLRNFNLSKIESYIGSIFFIFLNGISDFSQCLSSGIVCIPIISYITYVISKNEFEKKDVFYIGFLLAILSLVRQNLIIFSLLVSLLIFLRIKKQDVLNRFLILTLSGLFPILIIIFLYSFYNDGIKILIDSYIFAALGFAENGNFQLNYFILWTDYFLKSGSLIIYFIAVISNLAILFFEKNKKILNIVYLNIFLIISIISVAKPHAQYLVSIYFSLSIIFVLALNKFIKNSVIIMCIFLAYTFVLTITLGLKYKYTNPDRWRYIAEELKVNIKTENVFFTSTPFYVLLNKKPIQKVFHSTFLTGGYPSIFNHIDNGNKNNLYYIKETMKKNPDWVIIDKFEQYEFFYSILKKDLEKNYNLFENKYDFFIYKRN